MGKIYTEQSVVLNFAVKNQSKQIQDLSSTTALRITFHRVNGTRKTGTMLLTTDGTDGAFYYTTLVTDLDEPGVWKAQAFYTLGGIEYPTEVVTFEVLPKG